METWLCPVFKTFHWLPISPRIRSKVLRIAYNTSPQTSAAIESKSHGVLLKHHHWAPSQSFWFRELVRVPIICISNKFPGDEVEAACLGTTLWEPLAYNTLHNSLFLWTHPSYFPPSSFWPSCSVLSLQASSYFITFVSSTPTLCNIPSLDFLLATCSLRSLIKNPFNKVYSEHT